MIYIRSFCFNIIFFGVLGLLLVIGTPCLFFKDRKYAFMFWNLLSRSLNFVTQYIGGIKYNIINKHLLDPNAPIIYASRHESIWETLIFIHMFSAPVFVLKEELARIPIFGALSKKVGSIEIDRKSGIKSLVKASNEINQQLRDGHQIIIFPEGTRVSYGNHAELKRGIAYFYKKAECNVMPIIHNSGKYWARRRFLKIPGTITVKFCEPIMPHIPIDEFMEKLENVFYNEIEFLEN